MRADGEFLTYRVDIVETGQLNLGDRIVRLRLDPANAPADIAIQSVQVFVHCRATQRGMCVCPP